MEVYNYMITIGVDIVMINRIDNIIKKRRESFYNRIFTEREISYIKKRNHNIKTISGLFAAKEAVSKAVGRGIGKLSWKDIEISHNSEGKPIVNISSKGWDIIKKLEINNFDISISHEKEYAVAFVIGYYDYNYKK
ncbi:MAG TPA: holo-ACP synthase [Tissierellaceae bacterium]|nr:holo-ACP synthase [Tissierellaceae bacterium]